MLDGSFPYMEAPQVSYSMVCLNESNSPTRMVERHSGSTVKAACMPGIVMSASKSDGPDLRLDKIGKA